MRDSILRRRIISGLILIFSFLIMVHSYAKTPNQPVVLVHGINSSSAMWWTNQNKCMIQELINSGYNYTGPNKDIFVIGDEKEGVPFEQKGFDNRGEEYAYDHIKELKATIDFTKEQTGWDKVILNCHSYGGLISLAYVNGGVNNRNGVVYYPYEEVGRYRVVKGFNYVPYKNDVSAIIMMATPIGGSNAATYIREEAGDESIEAPLVDIFGPNPWSAGTENLDTTSIFISGGDSVDILTKEKFHFYGISEMQFNPDVKYVNYYETRLSTKEAYGLGGWLPPGIGNPVLSGDGVVEYYNAWGDIESPYKPRDDVVFIPITGITDEGIEHTKIPQNTDIKRALLKEWLGIKFPGDIDNSDATYIQLNRARPVEVIKTPQTSYQFSPSWSPGIKDEIEIPYSPSSNTLVNILIYQENSSQIIRRIVTEDRFSTGNYFFSWDGRDNNGILMPEGSYTWTIDVFDPVSFSNTYQDIGEIIIDNTPPEVRIDNIDIVSGERINISGRVNDDHLREYKIEVGDRTSTYELSVEDGYIGSIDTSYLPEETYSINLTAWDYAGNTTTISYDWTLSRTEIIVDRIVQSQHLGTPNYKPPVDDPEVWIEDDLPGGSTPIDNWLWDSSVKYSGFQSHTDGVGSGRHHHYIIHADKTLTVPTGDNIIQYVYLDPQNPPRQIMLQFYIENGDGEHRVYWGENLIQTGGVTGTGSLYYMGNLPHTGKWVRLKIPARAMGMENVSIKGALFATYDGRTWWDRTTTSRGLVETQATSWGIVEPLISGEDNNISTTIYYTLKNDANFTLQIYDKNNEIVRTLIDNQFQTAGSHYAVWDGKDNYGNFAPDGNYTYRFTTSDEVVTTGAITINNITAVIRAPYDNSLVQATIPIIGTASARDFKDYAIEIGAGRDPTIWSTLITSTTEVIDTYVSIPTIFSISGNLATWIPVGSYAQVPDRPGLYTIRLVVRTTTGLQKETRVTVDLATVVFSSSGRNVYSSDGQAELSISRYALDDDVELFSINPVDMEAVSQEGLTLIGKVYEFKPESMKFLKPVPISIHYTEPAGADENRLSIYAYEPLSQRWIYQPSTIDTAGNWVTTSVSSFSPYKNYFAVFLQGIRDKVPVIYQPLSPTQRLVISVFGKFEPERTVELFIDDVSKGTISTTQYGYFISYPVGLKAGDNYISASSKAGTVTLSPRSEPVMVKVILIEPHEVTSLKFKTSDFSQNLTGKVSIGDTLYMELIGTDSASETIDSSLVRLTSSLTNQEGILLDLVETGTNTGIYRGTAQVSVVTSQIERQISAVHSGEMLTVTSEVDSTRYDAVQTKDILPPPAPRIWSSTHPSFIQDTFEIDFGEWSNLSGIFGATLYRDETTSSTGKYSLKLVKEESGGDFGAYVTRAGFDAREYPLISFDYKIPHDVKVNLIAYCNGMWKEIVLTDEPKRVETFEEDLYRTIGEIDIISDNNWRHAEFNLYNMLVNDDPTQTSYIVEEFIVADYNLTGWMELVMGDGNPQGATYYIDNFLITETGNSNNSPQFRWQVDDPGVVGYSYTLDGYPDTSPDETIDTEGNEISFSAVFDGIWYFHVRAMDGAGNWGKPNHYRMKVDGTGPLADSPVPEHGSRSFSSKISLIISDSGGSGVDPASIRLKVKDTVYDINSGGISYDQDTETLTLELWKTTSPPAFADGEYVTANLLSAYDYAGNALQEVFTWNWTVDYSELGVGNLLPLTTKGGYTPSWSPDETKIAFMSERSGNLDIWMIDSDDYHEQDNTAVQLTTDPSNDHHPAWSPLGDKIAFVSDRTGIDKLWLINPDGNGLTQLTSGVDADSHPTWSPDGTEIAFSRNGDIWKINVASGREVQVTYNPVEYNMEPNWSKDGQRIVFRKSLYADELWVMNANGTGERLLTWTGADFVPCFLPDSKRIVFSSERDYGIPSLWIMNSDGSDQKILISNPEGYWDTEPDWAPTSSSGIAFQSTRSGAYNIWVQYFLEITDISSLPDPFSPNGDGTREEVEIGYSLSVDKVKIDVKVYDADDNPIRTLAAQEEKVLGENAEIWDGSDTLGEVVPDGIYIYKITGYSATGDKVEREGSITLDTTPPVTTLNSSGEIYVNGTTNYADSGYTYSLTAQDNLSGVDHIEVDVDDVGFEIYSQPILLTAEGLHTIVYKAMDKADNWEEEKTFSITLDATPPDMNIFSPQGGEVFVAKKDVIFIDFAVTDNMPPQPSVKAYLMDIEEGTKIEVIDGQRIEPLSIDDGFWVLTIEAKDIVGNISTLKSGQFRVIHDIQPPRTTILVGDPKYETEPVYVTSRTIFSLTVVDDLIEVGDGIGLEVALTQYRIDASDWIQYVPFTIAQEGEHTIYYRSIDTIGNLETAKSLRVYVDNTAPVTRALLTVEPNEHGWINLLPVRIHFEVTDNLSGVSATTPSQDVQITTEGIHEIKFHSVDNLGNVEEEKLVIVRIDITPPKVFAQVTPPPNGHGWNDTDVTVTFTAEDGLSGILDVSQSMVVSTEGSSQVITGQATDLAGNTGTVSVTLNIDKTAPVIEVASRLPEPNESGWNNSPVTVKYSVSDTLSGVDENTGGYEDDIVSSEGMSQSVSGSLTDKAGNTSSVTISGINIDLTPPVADAGPDQSVDEGSPITFDGKDSSDNLSGITSYAWDFGDPNAPEKGEGPNPTHIYSDDGIREVTLTLYDVAGNGPVTDTVIVTVNNVAPTAEAGSDQTVNEGDTVQFSGSHTDPGLLDTHTYRWDFGDGSTAEGTNPTHTYGDNGVWTVTLTVTDDDGGIGTDTLRVTVNNVPPTVEIGDDNIIDENTTVTFTGTLRDPGSLDTHTAIWDFGDGTEPVTGTIIKNNLLTELRVSGSHSYELPGVYIVTLTVTDDDGSIGQDTLKITVQDAGPPNVQLISPSPENIGLCQIINGIVTIVGIANDIHPEGTHPVAPTPDNFGWYKIEYAPGKDADSGWHPITDIKPTSIIEPTAIASWDTTEITSGYYTLKLIASEILREDNTTKPNISEVKATVYVGEPELIFEFGKEELNKPAYLDLVELPDNDGQDILYLPDGNMGWIELEDGEDALLVTDRNNDTIAVYTTDGTQEGTKYVSEIFTSRAKDNSKKQGKHEDHDSEENKPEGIVTEVIKVQEGYALNIYLSDRNNDRILKLTPDEVIELGGDIGFNKPTGIAIDSMDKIYVTDTNNNRLTILNPDGSLLNEIAVGFNKPTGIEVIDIIDDEGHLVDTEIYITDRNNDRLLRLNPEGQIIMIIGDSGSAPNQFNKPMGVYVNELGYIYVTDRNNDRVLKFDKYGNLKMQLGMLKDSVPLFNKPMGIILDILQDTLYVVDQNNDTIKVFGMREE